MARNPFASQTRTSVATAVSRVIDDALVPDLVNEAVLRTVLAPPDASGRATRTIGDEVVRGVLTGFGLKCGRMFARADTANGGTYHLGLPNHTLTGGSQRGLADTRTWLDAQHTGGVVVTGYRIGAFDPLFAAWALLESDYAYDPLTNTFVDEHTPAPGAPDPDPSPPSGATGAGALAAALQALRARAPDAVAGQHNPVYLEHLEAVIDLAGEALPGEDAAAVIALEERPAASRLEVPANRRYTPWVNPYAGEEELSYTTADVTHVLAHTAQRTETGQIERQVMRLVPVRAGGVDDEVIQATYRHGTQTGPLGGLGGTRARFTYVIGAGTIAGLDALEDVSDAPARFMPVVLFVDEGVDLSVEPGQDGGGGDAEALARYASSDALCRTLGRGFDYAELGAEIQAQLPPGNEIDQVAMLFAVPIDARDEVGVAYLARFFAWLRGQDRVGGEQPRSVSFEDGGFRMKLGYRALTGGYALGTVGDGTLGAVERIDSVLEIPRTVRIERPIESDGGDAGTTVTFETVIDEVTQSVFRHQIAPGFVETSGVVGLQGFYRVRDRNVRVGLEIDEEATGEPGEPGEPVLSGTSRLLIPVHRDLAQALFNPIEQERFYARSLHLVFHSRSVQRIPWYATDAFQGVLFVASVIVTAASLGSAAAPIGAALQAGAYTAASIALVKVIVVQLVVGELFEVLARELGAEAALALAVVAATAGVAGTSFGLPADAARGLLFTANGLSEAGTAQTGRETRALYDALALLEDDTEQTLALIDELTETLGLGDKDPGQQRLTRIVAGQSASDFFALRTRGNPGVAVLDHARTYVSGALALPTQIPMGRADTDRSDPDDA